MHFEVAGQSYHGNVDAAQAERAMAHFAIEVCMQVVEMLAFLTAVACVVAHSIFERASPVVNGVQQVVSEKQGDAAVDGRLVDTIEPVFKRL